MSIESRELALFAVNDNQTYQLILRIIRNMMIKKLNGKYDRNKAIKAFIFPAELAAKRYCEEFCDETPWFEIFDVKSRIDAAVELRDDFEAEAKLGNYDYMIR